MDVDPSHQQFRSIRLRNPALRGGGVQTNGYGEVETCKIIYYSGSVIKPVYNKQLFRFTKLSRVWTPDISVGKSDVIARQGGDEVHVWENFQKKIRAASN